MSLLSSFFGVVIPGRPVLMDFQMIDTSKAITIIANPSTVPELSFFILPNQISCIPYGYGAILYYSISPFQHWSIIGCITPDKPSGTFRTGWTTNEEIIQSPMIQLGVSIEPLETIHNLNLINSGYEDRFAFAHKIALDLFQYMTSFSQSSQPGIMQVPTNIFDRWLEKFERKYKLDPNFMMKSSS